MTATPAVIDEGFRSRLPLLAREYRWYLTGFVMAAAAAVAYALVVPRGLPYDEPAHWLNVLHIAQYWTLPVVGSPDVGYEAQQAPLVYAIDAVIYAMVRPLSADAGFYAVRLSGLAWLLLAAVMTWRLARRCLPTVSRAAIATGVVVAWASPMLLACAMSVQNDVPALGIALLALDVATVSALTPVRSAAAGALAGLAILTKFTAWPLLACLGVWALWRKRRLLEPLIVGAAALLVCGWWLLRNQMEYGDLTGASSLTRIGIDFPPSGVHGVGTVIELVRAAVTFLWLPVEYYRNEISAPSLISAVVVLGSVVIVAGGTFAWTRTERRSPFALVLATGLLAVAGFVIVNTFVEGAAFRVAYLILPAWAMLVAALVNRRAVWTLALVPVLSIALNAWVLTVVWLLHGGQ